MSELPPMDPPAPDPAPVEPPRFSIGRFLLGLGAGFFGGGLVCGGAFAGILAMSDALHLKSSKPFTLTLVLLPTLVVLFALVRSTQKHTSSFQRGLLLGLAVQFLLWSACAVLLMTLRIGG